MTPDNGAVVSPLDAANQLLAETPCMQHTAVVKTAAGQRMAMTIRTPSTTVTVFLSKKEAREWAHNLKVTADQMSSSGLIVASPGMPVLDGQGS